MIGELWRLAGPQSFLGEIGSAALENRRNVYVVLPTWRLADPDFTDGFVSEIRNLLSRDATVVPVRELDASLLDALHSAWCWGDEIAPLDANELLNNELAAGLVGLLQYSDVPEERRGSLSRELSDLGRASRNANPATRPILVTVGPRQAIPFGRDSADVQFEVLWWWGVINPWDTGSVATQASEFSDHDVREQARLETIVAIAGWDLTLTRVLAEEWDGDPSTLGLFVVPASRGVAAGALQRRVNRRSLPPPDLLDHWDAGAVEHWRGAFMPSAQVRAREARTIDHAVWAAQARVFLPWIEEMRQDAYHAICGILGEREINRMVESGAVVIGESGLLELGALEAVLSSTRMLNNEIRHAVRHLRHARNRLAHLQSISLQTQNELVSRSGCLRS